MGTYNKIISASKNLQSSINFAGKIIHQGSGRKTDYHDLQASAQLAYVAMR